MQMSSTLLLKALAADAAFARAFRDGDLMACTVLVVQTAALQADGVKQPRLRHETGDSVVPLSDVTMTLGELAAAVGVNGAPLCSRASAR